MSMAYIFLEDWPSSSPSWTLRYVNKAGCSEATVVEVEEPQVAMEEEMAGWYVIFHVRDFCIAGHGMINLLNRI